MILLYFFCRYVNTADIELRHAAFEQQKITEKRLKDTFARQEAPLDSNSVVDRRAANLASQLGSSNKTGQSVSKQRKTSPITTHVLDTCNGRPASGVSIDLDYCPSSSPHTWIPIGRGKTNSDGRVADLLPADASPQPGWYCLTFHVGEYVEQCRIENPTFFRDASFYPFVKIHFSIRQDQVNQHFHVPLTWNPFGYSTYRGS
ncbi:hypothetical protein M9435_004796 [Picochlorum sp. BPE23]|nr:hypothetical protein M9435_004796 [Picochlorum sp. BPE23]